LRAGSDTGLQTHLWWAAALGAAGCAGLLWLLAHAELHPTLRAHDLPAVLLAPCV